MRAEDFSGWLSPLSACGGIDFSARPPTTSLKQSGIVEADETSILESFKAPWSDLPRQTRRRFPAMKTIQTLPKGLGLPDRSCAA
jgi:hypothetical protein